MPFYAAPGVYVQEVPSGARTIGAVGTSVAGFVGTHGSARRNEAVMLTNWTQFMDVFASSEEVTSTPLARAVYGFFDNGGALCYVVNIAEGEAIAGTGRHRSGLQLLEEIDEIAIVAAPGFNDVASYEALLSHCEKMQDRVAILDPPSADRVEINALTKVGTAPAPRRAGRAAAEGAAAGADEAAASGGGAAGESPGYRPRQSQYGAFYFPEIQVNDPLTGESVYTPPSGHIAGVWGWVDANRGVHYAPANVPIRGVTGLRQRVTRQEQELLNPKGVNCIRTFADQGTLIWGARMLTAEADSLRYINVRRLMLMLKESIEDGTRWIVFQPNDYELWSSIRSDVGGFLTRVWRDGALFGRTPQQAFFVKCDEETNPPDVRDAGQVVTVIGVAPVKPAEFVVFKISQTAGGSETQIIGG